MREAIQFQNPRGQRLSGQLKMPEDAESSPVVVFAHARGSGKGSMRNVRIAEHLLARGIGYVLFDFSGHGDSGGDPDSVTVEDFVGDLRAVVDGIHHHRGRGAIGLCGSGTGAAAALAEACEDRRVESLVLRGPSDEAHATDAGALAAPTMLIGGKDDPEEAHRRLHRLAEALPCEKRLIFVAGTSPLYKENDAFGVILRETVDWFDRTLR